MKRLAAFAFGLLLLILTPKLADAFPVVGDHAKFSILRYSNDGIGVDQLSFSLLSYDEETTAFQMLTEMVYFDGETASVVSTRKKDQFVSAEMIESLLASCKTLETLKVPAGTFETCHLRNGTGDVMDDVWIGRVPFGIVQSQFEDPNQGISITRKLIDFRHGE